MIAQQGLVFFAEKRPAALVVGHERSGSHFLMNALAACYGYVSQPWVNFDLPSLNINYFSVPDVYNFLRALVERPVANTVKSHHPADFFGGELASLSERYVVFVICRSPVALLPSYWRFIHRWPWVEGPRAPDPVAFARAEPCGRMMRYQMRQHPNLMRRWAAHVEGWLDVADTLPHVKVVRYEDLDAHYEETMRSFAGLLGQPPQSLARPARDLNVIPGGPADPTGLGVQPSLETLRQLCLETVGDTMARLGYAASK